MAHQLQDFYLDLADEKMVTSFALVHSRFSTNTLGAWRLAHPYRFIIHNGEINTLQGNINWMAAREKNFRSDVLGDDVSKLVPIVTPYQSDTATLDNALEVLLASGRSLEHAMMMLIPEAWGDHIPMDEKKRDFYEYHSSMTEPWGRSRPGNSHGWREGLRYSGPQRSAPLPLSRYQGRRVGHGVGDRSAGRASRRRSLQGAHLPGPYVYA